MDAPLLAWLAQHCATISTLIIAAALTALLLFPLLEFLSHGWVRREQEISDILTDEAKKLYLSIFHQSIEVTDAQDAADKFKIFYGDGYGRKHFLFPMILLFAVTATESYFIADALQDLVKPNRTPGHFSIAVAAMAGAYGYVCWDLIARMQQRNLSRADVCRSTLQLALAVPTGFAFGTLSNLALAPLLAFAAGFLPFQTIMELLRRQARKQLPIEAEPEVQYERVTALSGVDAPTAARLADANITTVVQLAWHDPVDLTMHTNLQFIYVLDITSQALAWVYFEAKLNSLRKFGLRGAIEMSNLLERLQSREAVKRKAAHAALREAAPIVKIGEPAALTHTLIDISSDPMTRFLETIWESLRKKVKRGSRTRSGRKRKSSRRRSSKRRS
jgi:hypothetical protein